MPEKPHGTSCDCRTDLDSGHCPLSHLIRSQNSPRICQRLRAMCDQSSLKINRQQSALSDQPKQTPERYAPLPINASAEGYKSKKTSKMTPIRPAKTT